MDLGSALVLSAFAVLLIAIDFALSPITSRASRYLADRGWTDAALRRSSYVGTALCVFGFFAFFAWM